MKYPMWTPWQLKEIGELKRYGNIYYAKRWYVLKMLLVSNNPDGKRRFPTKRDDEGRFLCEDVNLTVGDYCRQYIRELGECHVGSEKEVRECMENNYFCKKFEFSPYTTSYEANGYSQ
jgi:hypothetical protein